MIKTIAFRELRSLFLSPLAWSIYPIVFVLVGYDFSNSMEMYVTSLQEDFKLQATPYGFTAVVVANVFGFSNLLMLLVIPLLTMRVISGERQNGVIPLYFSAPISMTELVIGKYLGVVIFILIMILLLSLMPLSMLLYGSLDMSHFASILLGSFLTASTFAAIGVYMSCINKEPIAAAMSGFGMFLLLFIIDLLPDQNEVTAATKYISILSHDNALNQGIFKTSDLIYFICVISFFIVLSIRRLDDDRLQR